MRPSPAEIARTLVRGRLPGLLHLPGRPEPVAMPHATDRTGRPLVLVRDGDDLVAAAAALSVEDVPPLPRAPSLGRVRVDGRLHRLASDEAAAAVHEFAEANPIAGLLDVGRGASICRLDVSAVRLDRGHATVDIDPIGYAGAEPDPLHELERDLLLDLAGHHATQIESYFRCLLAMTGRPTRTPPRPLRLDRYGFLVDIGEPDRCVRLSFHRPVHCRHDLAHLLHPVLFPTCPDP
jgi:hypothetical protein